MAGSACLGGVAPVLVVGEGVRLIAIEVFGDGEVAVEIPCGVVDAGPLWIIFVFGLADGIE